MTDATLSATAALTAAYSGFANEYLMVSRTSLHSFCFCGGVGVTVHRVMRLWNTPLFGLLLCGEEEISDTPVPLTASTIPRSGRQVTRLVYVSSKPPQPAVRSARVGQRRGALAVVGVGVLVGGDRESDHCVTRDTWQYGRKLEYESMSAISSYRRSWL